MQPCIPISAHVTKPVCTHSCAVQHSIAMRKGKCAFSLLVLTKDGAVRLLQITSGHLTCSVAPLWPTAIRKQVPYPSGVTCFIKNCTNLLCGAGYFLDDTINVCVKCAKVCSLLVHASQCVPLCFASGAGFPVNSRVNGLHGPALALFFMLLPRGRGAFPTVLWQRDTGRLTFA